MSKIPEIEVGNLKVRMTVAEFIEFLQKTDPAEMSQKLQAMAKQPQPPTSPP